MKSSKTRINGASLARATMVIFVLFALLVVLFQGAIIATSPPNPPPKDGTDGVNDTITVFLESDPVTAELFYRVESVITSRGLS
ncbi:MAG: hypothetical protein ACFFD4_18165 [Candidatus Odinarchaeota archaeon]